MPVCDFLMGPVHSADDLTMRTRANGRQKLALALLRVDGGGDNFLRMLRTGHREFP